MAVASGRFIDPDPSLQDLDDPLKAVGHGCWGTHRAIDHMAPFLGRDALFDQIVGRIRAQTLPYEDLCSAKYYADVFSALRGPFAGIRRVVEAGVYMGGASAIFAGALPALDYDLDLVDIDPAFLRFTHERIRRSFPESVHRIRLFHGPLVSYVQQVLVPEATGPVFLHHDAAHDFMQVVKDLSALSFARDKLAAIAIQDTHLRGRIKNYAFVDAALYAVFGNGMAFMPTGTAYPETDTLMTTPNAVQGNYFLPGAPEGMILPMAQNQFRYPHPAMTLDEFV